MNRNIGLWVVAGMVSLALFAGPASGSLLLLIDDFSNTNIRTTSPLPGEGGGTLGGTNFWVSGGPWANGIATNYVEDGYLNLKPYLGEGASFGSTTLRSSVVGIPEFSFMGMAEGEGLLMTVREFSFVENAGTIYYGLYIETNSFFRAQNAAAVIVLTNRVQFLLKEAQTPGSTTPLFTLTAPSGQTVTGWDVYIDSVNYEVTAYFSGGGILSSNAAHGFNAADPSWTNALRLAFETSTPPTNTGFHVRVGEVTITQIPEPGSIGLLVLLGAGLLVRRSRRVNR